MLRRNPFAAALHCLLVLLFLVACGPTAAVPPPTATPEPGPPSTMPSATDTPVPDTPTIEAPATESATATPGPGATRVVEPDGMILAYVPAGEFAMGTPLTATQVQADEAPRHTVMLDAFWIDRTEVTNAQYALCVVAGACTPPGKTGSATRATYYGDSAFDAYPVIEVTWTAANSYCAWAGRRLPTEAEWEKAARGTDARLYPWGETAPAADLANVVGGPGDTQAVGVLPLGASPFGALDMAGNVMEWVADVYDAHYYYDSPAVNPAGPESGTRYVLRGGAWAFPGVNARTARRAAADATHHDFTIGFRCAR
jgi:serine/threonine-protein kinase